MSIPIATVWEVRSATGSDNNGGGYLPGSTGTDYSQQTSPQYALTGLASAGSGATILSAAAAANMVGNIANVVSGTNVTPGLYFVLSVSVGVSITFDSSVATGVATSVVINIGGARAKLSTTVAAATQNNIIYFKGSETVTSTMNLSLSFSGSNIAPFSPFSIIGYGSTRGDGGRATFTTATNSVNAITYSGGQYSFQNLLISCTAGTPGHGIIANTAAHYYDLSLVNCRITGFNEGIRSPFNTQIDIVPLTIINCEIDSCTVYGVHTVSRIAILYSYIHDNASDGFFMDTVGSQVEAGYLIVGSVIKSNGGDGVHHTTQGANNISSCDGHIVNCALINNTGAGYHFSSGTAVSLNIINSIIDSNGTGFSGAGNQTIVGVQFNNAVWNNTTLRSNFPPGIGEVTLTGDPFTSRSTGDFSLNATAGAGAACKAAGFQSTIL